MEFLQKFGNAQVILSLSIIIIAIVINIISSRMLRRIMRKYEFNSMRKSIVSKILHISIFLIVGILLLGIWEIDPDDLGLYLASIFTIIGLAFFHQRSHLSNITAGVILFFNHPVKIGDLVSIYERDVTFNGKIIDVGLFFVSLKSEEGEKIIISNTLFLQRTVSFK